MLVQDVGYDVTILISIFCPMNDRPIANSILFKLFKQVGQMGVAIHFKLRGSFAQLFPLGHVVRHAVTLLAHHP